MEKNTKFIMALYQILFYSFVSSRLSNFIILHQTVTAFFHLIETILFIFSHHFSLFTTLRTKQKENKFNVELQIYNTPHLFQFSIPLFLPNCITVHWTEAILLYFRLFKSLLQKTVEYQFCGSNTPHVNLSLEALFIAFFFCTMIVHAKFHYFAFHGIQFSYRSIVSS